MGHFRPFWPNQEFYYITDWKNLTQNHINLNFKAFPTENNDWNLQYFQKGPFLGPFGRFCFLFIQFRPNGNFPEKSICQFYAFMDHANFVQKIRKNYFFGPYFITTSCWIECTHTFCSKFKKKPSQLRLLQRYKNPLQMTSILVIRTECVKGQSL